MPYPLLMNLKACFIILFALGCGSDRGNEGESGGECYPNNTCNAGLICEANVCETGGIADAAIPDSAVTDGPVNVIDAADATVSDAAPACSAATNFQFVINDLVVPVNASMASDLAQDIDGDGKPDNAFGGLLGALSSTANIDVQTPTDEQVITGSVIHLLNIAADDLNSGCAAILTYEGDSPSPTPCANPVNLATCGRHLQGTGSFGIAASTPNTAIEGDLSGGEFSTSGTNTPANAFVAISMTAGSPIILRLFQAKITTSVSSGALTDGKIGGGISTAEIDSVLLPAMHASFQSTIAADCSPVGNDCGCAIGSNGEQMLGLFDTNNNCQLALQEFVDNSLINATVRSPDLDLLDANGMPGDDGVPDHLSFGLGFSATSASF